MTARDLSVVDRLIGRRHITERGCWEYTGAKGVGGYGLICVGKEILRTHAVAWRLWVGGTEGFCVLHACDCPACFNPEHLFLGTREDNNRDRDLKGRHVALKGSANPNAKLTEQQVCEVRRDFARGLSQKVIAAKHGVSRPNISRIVTRKTWL